MDRTADVTLQVSTQLLADRSARAGFVLLGAFLLSFAFIRMSARLMRSPRVPWWPGSVKTAGGLHVHHLVFGIVLMLLFGLLAIAVPLPSPWFELVAAGFGVGAGLTLDEYALWLHLEDVYWAEEGRRSVDAVIIAATVGGLIVLGARPLDAKDTGSVVGTAVAIAVVLVLSAGALLKGRTMLGLVGLVFPPLSLWGLVRLAHPTSPWARRRYPPGSRRMRWATARFERQIRRHRRWQERIGGAPSVTRSDLVAPVNGSAAGVRADGHRPRAAPVDVRPAATTREMAIRVAAVDDLFVALDARPVAERPLADDVRGKLLDEWDRGRGDGRPVLYVHAPATERECTDEDAVGAAVRRDLRAHTHGPNRAKPLTRRERVAVSAGVLIFVATIAVSTSLDRVSSDILVLGISQAIVVIGWVALWDPAQRVSADIVPHYFARKRYAELVDVEVRFVWTGEPAVDGDRVSQRAP